MTKFLLNKNVIFFSLNINLHIFLDKKSLNIKKYFWNIPTIIALDVKYKAT